MLKDNLKEACLKQNWRKLPLYAQLVTFKISLPLVQLLYETRITPNQVTFFALALACGAAYFFAQGKESSSFIGALMLEAYYVFDCVDGQLARIKHLSSREGAFVDYLFNYIVHPLVFFAIGLGCFQSSGKFIFVCFGTIAAWALILNYALSDCKNSLYIASLLKETNFTQVDKVNTQEAHQKAQTPFVKRIFMTMHKLATYPSIMNMITLATVMTFFTHTKPIFYGLIILFAVNTSIVFIVRLIWIIRGKKIESEYNIFKMALAHKEV